jgi:hypothetical protein
MSCAQQILREIGVVVLAHVHVTSLTRQAASLSVAGIAFIICAQLKSWVLDVRLIGVMAIVFAAVRPQPTASVEVGGLSGHIAFISCAQHIFREKRRVVATNLPIFAGLPWDAAHLIVSGCTLCVLAELIHCGFIRDMSVFWARVAAADIFVFTACMQIEIGAGIVLAPCFICIQFQLHPIRRLMCCGTKGMGAFFSLLVLAAFLDTTEFLIESGCTLASKAQDT